MHAVVFSAALRDFFRIRRVGVWIGVALLLFAMGKLWVGLPRDPNLVESYGQISTVLLYRVLALSAAILATAVLSAEIEQKTIVYLLTRPIPRWKLLISRTAAAMTVVFVVGALGTIASALGVFGLSGLAKEVVLRDFLGVAAGAAVYVAFFVLLSMLINRAMIVCLLYAFGWETAASLMPGDLYVLSIYRHLMSAIGHKLETAQGPLGAMQRALGSTGLPPTAAWIVLGCILVVCLGMGAIWFSTHEYLPREDVE